MPPPTPEPQAYSTAALDGAAPAPVSRTAMDEIRQPRHPPCRRSSSYAPTAGGNGAALVCSQAGGGGCGDAGRGTRDVSWNPGQYFKYRRPLYILCILAVYCSTSGIRESCRSESPGRGPARGSRFSDSDKHIQGGTLQFTGLFFRPEVQWTSTKRFCRISDPSFWSFFCKILASQILL